MPAVTSCPNALSPLSARPLSYAAQAQLGAGCRGADREQFVSREPARRRKRHMAPMAELVNNLIRADTGISDRTADF